MAYEFMDTTQSDEVMAREGYYRDWTQMNPNVFHQIMELVTFIREKGEGWQVREAISQAFERIYHDMSLGGNANMEVSAARGNFETLVLRLANMDSKISNTMTQSEFDSWVATLLDGGPSIFMDSLAVLQSTYPNGAAGVALVRETDPAKIYVWDGSVWQDFGDYQGIEVKDNTVTSEKIATEAVTQDKVDFVETGKNLFDKSKRTIGYVVRAGFGDIVVSSGGNSVSDFIKVLPSTDYYKTSALGQAFYDRDRKYISGLSESPFWFRTPANAYFTRVNLAELEVNTFQVELGIVRTAYEPFYYKIKNARDINRRGQLSSDIELNLDLNYLEIPQGTIIKDNKTQYTSPKSELHDLNSVPSTNKYLYYDESAQLFIVDKINGIASEANIFLGSGFFNAELTIENYIGKTDERLIAYRTGKNLIDPTRIITGHVINSGGGLTVSPSGSSVVHHILAKPSTTYVRNFPRQMAYYDRNKNFIAFVNDGLHRFTTPANCYYISLNFAPADSNVQLEFGENITAYEPYLKDILNNTENDLTYLGVRVSLSASTSKAERLAPLQKDISTYYPFNEIKVCNLSKTAWGATQVIYEGDSGFTRDGSNGDVMVEIPKHYFKRTVKDGFEHLHISGTAKDGYQVDPAFVENGKELDKIYIAAYEGYIDDDEKLRSMSGVIPTTRYTLTEFRSYVASNGKGYGLLDYRTLAMLQRLFMVYYADRNSEALGKGMTMFTYQSNNHAKAVVSATNSNVIRVGVPNNDNRQKVGQNVQISDNPWNIDVPFRKITNIVEESNGELTITFSGTPINITAGTTIIASRVQDTGYTDSVVGLNGQSNAFGGDAGWEAIKFLGIENLWGNAWNEIDGIALDNLVPYVGINIDDYSSSLSDVKAKYVPLSAKLPLQESNHQGSASDNSDEYIRNLLLDPIAPACQLPFELGASAETHYTDPLYTYADVSSMNAGEYLIPAHGGGIDHNYRAGLFTMRFWYTPDQTWNSMHNCRLIYKAI